MPFSVQHVRRLEAIIRAHPGAYVVIMGKGLYDDILDKGFSLSHQVGAFPLIYMACPVTCTCKVTFKIVLLLTMCVLQALRLQTLQVVLCLQIIVPD